jgi:octaprenyl-diphosphate synthase
MKSAVLSEIKAPIKKELNNFETFFKAAVKSNVPLLNIIMNYILSTKGKQIRPVVVLYSAKMLGGINETTYRAATLIELLHTATLVHDDVVDNSDHRRNLFTVNALWKNKVAVLAGDYLLSRGMLTALESKDYELLEIISRAVKDMSEGELLQMEKARRLDITEEVYFEVIRKKTASLMAAAFGCGAASVSNNMEEIEKMRQIGEWAGIAFQIKDDLLDYNKKNITGKPKGTDIKEKKMTLPLINMLQHIPGKQKRDIIRTFKKKNVTAKDVDKIIIAVKSSNGMEYAKRIMNEYKNRAINLLNEFPDNPSRKALEDIITYSIERAK